MAAGLDRPDDEVFAVAHGQTLEASKITDALINTLAFNYGKLTKRDKDAIAPLLRALQREMEFEANIVAACALIPFPLLRSRDVWQFEEEYGYSKELIAFRVMLFQQLSI